MGKPILVTGAAGFIGFHTCLRLLRSGRRVVGVDNLSEYYSVALKRARLDAITREFLPDAFLFQHSDLADPDSVDTLFQDGRFAEVIHLAAQPGVRQSIKSPQEYMDANVTAFFNIIEACRYQKIDNFIFASSSSVYGNSANAPFREDQNVDHPISLYAATKKSNELMAYTYSHLFGVPTTGLRFFTVYGPWGRPDMAVYLFTDAIVNDREITLFREGTLLRDFTYVDDIVEGIARLLNTPPSFDTNINARYRIFNIGNHTPVAVNTLVSILESGLNRKARIRYAPMEPGDVEVTSADVSSLQRAIGFSPQTSLETGVGRFIDWYYAYHKTIGS